jgi:hypothetical protein
MPCHSENGQGHDPTKKTGEDTCLQTDHVLLEKSFAHGFLIPLVSTAGFSVNSAIWVAADLNCFGALVVNLRSVVLRI